MTRSANPIEALAGAVTPYVLTGEATDALAGWKHYEPDLAGIGRFDRLTALLGVAAQSNWENPVLDAMLRISDTGDRLARLVVLEAFAPQLFRATISLRIRVREDLETCADRVLGGFFSAVWSREDVPVPGRLLVTRTECSADHETELHGGFGPIAVAPGRFARLRRWRRELAEGVALIGDLAGVALRECGRLLRARADRHYLWEIVGGELCYDGEAALPPAQYPIIPTDQAWGLWGPREPLVSLRLPTK
jgi:hypothetical protein